MSKISYFQINSISFGLMCSTKYKGKTSEVLGPLSGSLPETTINNKARMTEVGASNMVQNTHRTELILILKKKWFVFGINEKM